jgi:mono/diheme cytochrome c family protein
LFGHHCAKCHGADGTGKDVRADLPKIPNFTDAAWQKRYRDGQLTVSILDGKGTSMPSFRGKIDQQQVRTLVTHVRAFAPTANKEAPKDKPADRVEERLRDLQQQLDELREQFRRLSEAYGAAKPAEQEKPNAVRPAAHQRGAAEPAAPAAAVMPAAKKLFAQHCRKCHGADGTGSPARAPLARIPNFTDASWQARRSDARLVASILDGRGEKMPSWRDKVSAEEARGLVAYIRTLAPRADKPPAKEPEGASIVSLARVARCAAQSHRRRCSLARHFPRCPRH